MHPCHMRVVMTVVKKLLLNLVVSAFKPLYLLPDRRRGMGGIGNLPCLTLNT